MDKYLTEYLRLSDDDEGTGESNSITSQRQIIEGFIASRPEFANIQIKEFSEMITLSLIQLHSWDAK